MSWCDRLASVPGAGFRLDHHFASSDAILEALAPVLDPLFRGDKPRFNVASQSSFEVQINTEQGFIYAVDPTKLSVTFKHQMRAQPTSGGPPVMELLSTPMPYTQLLREVTHRLASTAPLLPKSKERQITRVGVISTTSLAEQDLPPGIARFVEYISRPWSGTVNHFSISITADLSSGPGYSDRCIHTVNKFEDKEQLMTLNFDWQRTFTSSYPINKSSISEILGRAEKSALDYFEDIGEGSRFDEDIIRKAATARA